MRRSRRDVVRQLDLRRQGERTNLIAPCSRQTPNSSDTVRWRLEGRLTRMRSMSVADYAAAPVLRMSDRAASAQWVPAR